MKQIYLISLSLILVACSNQPATQFRFNKKELNQEIQSEKLENKKFKLDKFNFEMEVPNNWDIQKFDDSLNLSITLQATKWDSTDLSWSYQIQAINWKGDKNLEDLFLLEQEKVTNKHQAKILDKGKYISNNINHLWMLIERFEESIGLNQRQLLFYSKSKDLDCYMVSISITGSKNPHENLLKYLHYIDKFKLLK